MAPAIAPTTPLPGMKIVNMFCCDRNVVCSARRRIRVLPNAKTQVEVFIHRQNQILFHNCSFRDSGYAEGERRASRRLAFALQNLSRLMDTSS